MNPVNEKFLILLRTALTDEIPAGLDSTTDDEWQQILQTAAAHHVLPLIYAAACRIPGIKQNPVFLPVRQEIFQQVFQQVRKTNEFLQLFRHLTDGGITPLVTKGIICRHLYPQPDQRPSGDEDVLIPPAQFEACHRLLLDFGMEAAEDDLTAYEVPYRKPGSPLYIELHKSLFSPESDAYGDWNRFFAGVFDQAVEEDFYGTKVRTLSPTDHFFYLICHAFKHFLHGGFGIRQVCDIILFANKYGPQLDWERIMELCREIRGVKFTAALLKIGQRYLVLDPDAACCPPCWQETQVDEGPLLADLLESGIYGYSSMSRRHSSSITLDAMAAQNQGRQAKSTLVSALFPSAKKLEGRYPWLKDRPYLLPAAWADRILKYGKETKSTVDSSAGDAMRIGSQRIALMKAYDIID